MDGLRFIAALYVFWGHHANAATNDMHFVPMSRLQARGKRTGRDRDRDRDRGGEGKRPLMCSKRKRAGERKDKYKWESD